MELIWIDKGNRPSTADVAIDSPAAALHCQTFNPAPYVALLAGLSCVAILAVSSLGSLIALL
ncbi:MAG: hypothetical protein ACRDFS_05000 [Chloroflexota bacterium]